MDIEIFISWKIKKNNNNDNEEEEEGEGEGKDVYDIVCSGDNETPLCRVNSVFVE